eukprot:704240-Amphidinium_carterae.1
MEVDASWLTNPSDFSITVYDWQDREEGWVCMTHTQRDTPRVPCRIMSPPTLVRMGERYCERGQEDTSPRSANSSYHIVACTTIHILNCD